MSTRLLFLIFILYYQSIQLLADSNSDSYELGEGIQLGTLPIYVGGYISADIYYRDDYIRYRLDDIAFLSYGSKGKFSYMAELEFKDLYVNEQYEYNSSTHSDTQLHIERLYVDYALQDQVNLRIGKYNSPIGYWNMVPINVLRETTSNPITSYIIFPRFTTGVEINYQQYEEESFALEVSIQHNEDLDDEYNNYQIDEHYEVGIEYENGYFGIKLNGGYFHLYEQKQKRTYFLLAAKIEDEQYQILAEVGSQYGENEFTTTYAGYLQGLYRITEHHIAIARFESYQDTLEQDYSTLIGYTYRPLYPIALKGEYQIHSNSSKNAALFSFSVLF